MKKTFYILLSLLLLSNSGWANKTASIIKGNNVAETNALISPAGNLAFVENLNIMTEDTGVAVFTATAPVIDGTIDAVWSKAAEYSMYNKINAGAGDSSVIANWKSLWDSDNVYWLFDVKDDIRMNNGPDNDIWYLHDCIEAFIDMQNTKVDAPVTNSEGQYQLRFIYGLDEEPIYENPDFVDYKTVSKDNADLDGYVIEVSFPWALLIENTNVVIAEGLKYGLDFKVVDVDVATTGEWWPDHFEYAWPDGKDKKPINFGTVTLVKGSNTGVKLASSDVLKVYPNPAKDILQLKAPSSGYKNIEICDLSGKLVLKKSIRNSVEIQNIDISGLAGGIYFVSLTGISNTLRTKIVVE